MIEKDRYQDYSKSRDYWEIAKGLQTVDGLKTSAYLDGLVEENLKGKKTYHEVEENLKNYHSTRKDKNEDEKEADLSATRISMLLNEPDFRLTTGELLYTHKFIFQGVFPQEMEKYVGVIRDVNLRKEEDVLGGKSVIYTDFHRIKEYLDYDIAEENERIKKEEVAHIEHLTKFVSNIWNTHPFREGNTRTTAAFVLRYLRKYGYNVENDLFKDKSLYFRNALVFASDNEASIRADYSYLESFFTKLLVDDQTQLKEMP